ncbi:unnamed protein product [Ilex paraguariensis]|uniref:Uncharacterized protein n=1 Tax=Ilex paraguariensis TaxID=185542 RepID=A0ABC8SDN7_9AQUA
MFTITTPLGKHNLMTTPPKRMDSRKILIIWEVVFITMLLFYCAVNARELVETPKPSTTGEEGLGRYLQEIVDAFKPANIVPALAPGPNGILWPADVP